MNGATHLPLEVLALASPVPRDGDRPGHALELEEEVRIGRRHVVRLDEIGPGDPVLQLRDGGPLRLPQAPAGGGGGALVVVAAAAALLLSVRGGPVAVLPAGLVVGDRNGRAGLEAAEDRSDALVIAAAFAPLAFNLDTRLPIYHLAGCPGNGGGGQDELLGDVLDLDLLLRPPRVGGGQFLGLLLLEAAALLPLPLLALPLASVALGGREGHGGEQLRLSTGWIL